MRSQSAGLQFDSRMMKCSLRTACHSTAFRPRSGWSCGSTTNRPLAPKRRGVAIGRLACIRHKCHIKAALPNQRNVPIEAPALFVGFAATMAECDFSRSCIIGYGSARARQAAGAEFAEPHLAHHHMARRLIRSATLALCPRAGAHCADQGRRRTQETLLIEWQHSRDSRSNRVSLRSSTEPRTHQRQAPTSRACSCTLDRSPHSQGNTRPQLRPQLPAN